MHLLLQRRAPLTLIVTNSGVSETHYAAHNEVGPTNDGRQFIRRVTGVEVLDITPTGYAGGGVVFTCRRGDDGPAFRCPGYVNNRGTWSISLADTKRLLILSCSDTKVEGDAPMPALQRYNGPYYQILRKFFRTHPDHNVHVLILSAKYGLLKPGTLIDTYDQLMTSDRATELAPEVSRELSWYLNLGCYSQICVNLGANYLPALGYMPLPTIIPVTFLQGGLLTRNQQLKRWLEQTAT